MEADLQSRAGPLCFGEGRRVWREGGGGVGKETSFGGGKVGRGEGGGEGGEGLGCGGEQMEESTERMTQSVAMQDV